MMQCIVLLVLGLGLAWSQDLDQFTYQTTSDTSVNPVYAPPDWMSVRCEHLEECAGWPEKFLAAPDWTLTTNDCQWCPANGNSCGTHHQSPINLERNRAINESEHHNQCVDAHFMHRADSSCTWDELIRLNAFSIERYALQIKQPMEVYDGSYRVACSNNGDHRWAELDYSKGFSNWWWLSHTDFHVPSEHTQEGKRYDAEMQLYHFFSVSGADSKAGVPDQMGTVSIFFEAYEGAEDYGMLNKIICQWRRAEDETRAQCNQPSIYNEYVGCTNYTRGHTRSRNLRMMDQGEESAVVVDVEKPGVDWAELLSDLKYLEDAHHGRRMTDFEEVGPWNNYFGLEDVKTEYYFRYSGTQTIPPCYGIFTPGPDNRANTNHWRVMKDPIRVSPRQIDEMHRLLKNRIAPPTDPIKPCQPDSAAGSYEGNDARVNMSRPLQSTHEAHFMTFCECRWVSHFAEDQAWCSDTDQLSRLYNHPYNFESVGF
ncbi:hypothetical protein MPSEU_000326700 [Mayamaea pseudoterrestris]|nr:hypothetical protein MPSEU_000326700 [Mayamaea pseudoterrestris]